MWAEFLTLFCKFRTFKLQLLYGWKAIILTKLLCCFSQLSSLVNSALSCDPDLLLRLIIRMYRYLNKDTQLLPNSHHKPLAKTLQCAY